MDFPPIYDSVSQLYEEYNLLKLNGKCGVYNAVENSMIITYRYDDIECIMYNSKYGFDSRGYSGELFTGYFRVKLNNEYGICDKHGNSILPCRYDSIDIQGPYNESADSYTYCVLKNNGSCGIYDLIEGKYAIEMYRYEEIECIMTEENVMWHDYEWFTGLFRVKKNGKYGICDKLGHNIVSCLYDIVDAKSCDENSRIIILDGKYGIYNMTENKMIIQCQYDAISSIYYGCYDSIIDELWLLEKDKKYGLHNASLEIVPCIYDCIFPVTVYNKDNTDEIFTGFFNISQNSKHGICDRNGCIVIPCAYDSISDERYFWKVELYGKYGIYKNDNNMIPCIYDEIYSVEAKIYNHLQKDNYDTWGDMINIYNICDCSYLYLVKNNNKYGIYDIKQKKEIIPCKYDNIKFAIKKENYREEYTQGYFDIKIEYYKCLIDNQWDNIYV